MNKKITRRVVLGTTVAALAAAPFLIRRLRNQKSFEDTLREIQYGYFDVTGKGYNADVPQEQVKEAFDIFFKERDVWIRFRKFSGHVSLLLDDSKKKIESLFTFELLPSEVECEFPFPWMYRFTCQDPVTKKQLWTYTLDRNDNSHHFEGEEVGVEILGSHLREDSTQFYQALAFTIPIEGMYGFSNELVEEAFRTTHKVSVHPDAASSSGSYSFRPVESDSDIGQYLTENGVLTTLHTSRSPHDNRKSLQWKGFDWQSFGKLRFPSRIELSELTYGEDGTIEQKLLETYVFEDFTVS